MASASLATSKATPSATGIPTNDRHRSRSAGQEREGINEPTVCDAHANRTLKAIAVLRYYMTAQTRDLLIAESKRLVEERARKRREQDRRILRAAAQPRLCGRQGE